MLSVNLFRVSGSELNERKVGEPRSSWTIRFRNDNSIVILLNCTRAHDCKRIVRKHGLSMIAGYEGLVCGLSAFYLATAQVLDEGYRKNLLLV